MAQRLDLQSLLEQLLGSENVYFQAPSTLRMAYPAIRYKLDDEVVNHADNVPYSRTKSYQVTVIDQNPDSLIPDMIGQLPLCKFDRSYASDQLNHFVYNLFF